MVCPKCGATGSDGAAFCSHCGEKIAIHTPENYTKYCLVCGQVLEEGNKFCKRCGTMAGTTVQPNVRIASNMGQTSSGKIGTSYVVSMISAIISLVIRIGTQQTYYSWENLMNNRKVLGLDGDVKPFLTAIPVVAAIIASLLIVSDKNTSSQKKATAFIVNAVLIALGILFIWFDIPYAILDF